MDKPIVFESPRSVEVNRHAGGGAEVVIVDAKGVEHTLDIVPALEAGSDQASFLLSMIGEHLTVRIGQSVRHPERSPANLSDITDVPAPLILPVRLEQK